MRLIDALGRAIQSTWTRSRACAATGLLLVVACSNDGKTGTPPVSVIEPIDGEGEFSLVGGIMATMTMSTTDMIRGSDFIFEGTVTGIRYRSSDNRNSNDPDAILNGIAHTFVTYEISHVFKGPSTLVGQSFTLRSFGGVQPGGYYTTLGHNPLYDVGDRDVLMVAGNTQKACGLVSCMMGRFRALEIDGRSVVTSEHGQVYYRQVNETGRLTNTIKGFEFITPPEVMTHNVVMPPDPAMGQSAPEQVTFVTVAESESETDTDDDPQDLEPNQPASGERLSIATLRGYLVAAVQAAHTPAELDAIPAPLSADPDQPFTVEIFGDRADSGGTDNDLPTDSDEPDRPVGTPNECRDDSLFPTRDAQADCLEEYYSAMLQYDATGRFLGDDVDAVLSPDQIAEIQRQRTGPQ